MTRVLQVVTRLVVRGVPRHVLELASGLKRHGFAVSVAAGRGDPGEGSLWPEVAARQIGAVRIAGLQRAVSPAADLRALAALYSHIRRGRFEVVHTHISKAGILGRAAARLAGVPVVVHTYHGAVGEVEAPGALGAVFRALERGAARLSDQLVAVSADTAARCVQLGIGRADQYAVIHNGIDVARFAGWQGGRPEAFPAGDRVIGVVGSLTREKRVEALLEVLARLRSRLPALSLVIVGDGPLRAALAAQAERLGLAGQVVFAGLVGDVRPWLGHLDLLVTPSGREGLPIVLLEALAMGCPVVASRVGGIPEIVEDGVNGLLVDPDDLGALEGALGRLLADEPLRRRLGEQGRQGVAARFGLEGMLERTATLYRRLLAQRGRGP